MQSAVVAKSRRWAVQPSDRERARDLARATRVSPLLAQLLLARGVTDDGAARAFLEPALAHLHDPFLLPDVDRACDRLERAIVEGDPVLLYADYDVDGNTGAAVLHDILTRLGAKVSVHVPDRVKDGYGMKIPRLERARDEGVKVVVSIDNGVTAVAEAAFCKQVGLDLIVTDHHTMKPELPQPLALVHPRVPGSRYPNPHLCGAGVAFKLAWAIAQRRGAAVNGAATGARKPSPELRERLLSALGLVALGTIADVVALQGENRALVRFGLRALELGASPGVRALLDISSRDAEGERPPLDAAHVAFQIAPRLNAAGRMGDARRAFELLTAQTRDDATRLAAELDRENTKRRTVQKDTTEAARAEVQRVYGAEGPLGGIVVAGEGWPLGVVGIVAAKLVEDHRRPVLCLTIDGEKAKGSGRSIPEVDLLKCLEPCAQLLETWGGHAAACGLVVKRENLDAFREAWTASTAAVMHGTPGGEGGIEGVGEARLAVDLEVSLADVTGDLVNELGLLEPFGQGNRPPVLAALGVELAGEPRPMGRSGEHCSFFVKQGNRAVRAVAFGKPHVLDLLRARAMGGPVRPRFDVAFRPKVNRWNGTSSVELEVEDVRFPGEERA